MKRFFLVTSLLAFLLIFNACNSDCEICARLCPRCGYPEEVYVERSDMEGMMEVYVFGIGRADAVLITTENHAVLIDSGENHHGGPIAGIINGRGITLDYLIITHFDRDHVGGAHHIINWVDVENVLVPNYSRPTRHVERFETAMSNRGITPQVVTEPIRFNLDGAWFTIDPSDLPYKAFYVDIHDEYYDYDDYDIDPDDDDFVPTSDCFSLVVKVQHGRNDFLFLSDATTHRREQLLNSPEFMGTDWNFVKVQRHGRHDPRTNRFMNHLRDHTNVSVAVITGFHPDYEELYYPERPTDPRIIERLVDGGAEIFFTMSQHFQMRCDGNEFFVMR